MNPPEIPSFKNEPSKTAKEVEKQEGRKQRKRIMIIVCSDTLEKLIIALNQASAAAALGSEVEMFFTFYGATILKKKSVYRGKTWYHNLLSLLIKDGPNRNVLERLNFFGLGSVMMKYALKKYGYCEIQNVFNECQQLGVKFTVCTMSVDLFGIKKEELISDIDIEHLSVALSMNRILKSDITLMV